MKRLATISALGALAVSAFAQVPFTIMRPLDGATVRETVDVLMPKGSVEGTDFIGVTIDGKFVEATIPTYDDTRNALVYKLDTKKMGIPDGPHTLSIALYSERAGAARVVERSEVKIIVANRSGIDVPADGLLLRYKWRPGQVSHYGVIVSAAEATMTESQNRLGGRASERATFEEYARILFACDDVKPNGDGLVRAQLIPYKGENKDYLYVTVDGDAGPSKQTKDRFAPVYRLLSPTGREVLGDVPYYFGFLGTGVEEQNLLVAFLALPILPDQPKKIGEAWEAALTLPQSSFAKIRLTGKSYDILRARGVLEGVEWEMGRPCAKVQYVLEAAVRSAETETLSIAGREFRNNMRQKIVQTFWLDINEGRIVRSDFNVEADVKIDTQPQGGAAAGGAGAGPTGGPAVAGAASGGGGQVGQDRGIQRGQGTRGGPMIGPPSTGGGSGGTGGPGGRGVTGGAGGGTGSIFVRQKFLVRMVLEQP